MTVEKKQLLSKAKQLNSNYSVLPNSLSEKIKEMDEKYDRMVVPEKLSEAINSMMRAINRSIFDEHFTDEYREIIGEATKEFNRIFTEIGAVTKGLQASLEIIEQETPQALIDIANYGWYLNYDTLPKTPIELKEKLKEGKVEEVDKILSAQYDGELNEIEERIIRLNPKRTNIIKEAFENHRCKRYSSAIVLFLTLIDGICNEEFGGNFFSAERKKIQGREIYRTRIRNKIERENSPLKGFMMVINEVRGINALEKQESKYKEQPNRHRIIHGKDYEYGTRLNSLKIISLLNFINDIVRYDSAKKVSNN